MMARVTHFEIPADDVARAQTFYREAFDWEITPIPDMDYTMVSTTPSDESGMPTTPGGINGGMMRRQPPVDHPVITIQVDDINDALQRVEKMGGKTMMPRAEVADMGYTAYFSDPEGNVMGLWQSRR